MVEYLNVAKNHDWAISDLAHLDAPNSLAGAFQLFLLTCEDANLSPRTIEDYSQKIRNCINFCHKLGVATPNDVTTNHLRLFLLTLQDRCNANSRRDYHGCIKRFFNWLVEEELLEKNPMSSIKKPKVPQVIIQPFRPEHIQSLLLLFSDKSFLSLRNRAIVLTLLDTGLRCSELASIQLKDIDFKRGIIRVMGKGAKERFVAIGKKTKEAIGRYLLQRNSDLPCLWVTEERRSLRPLGIQIMIRRAGKRAGITGVRCSPHTFRHTFATQALRNGAQRFTVQLLLGHSDDRMTQRYSATLQSEFAAESHSQFSPVDVMLSK